MKKLYTFATIALLALTASATGRQKAVTTVQKPFKAVESISPLTNHASISTQAVGFANISEVAGDYEWSYYGLLEGESGPRSAIVEIKVTSTFKGTIEISGMVSAGTGITTPVTATVNLKNGTVTLPNKQDLGTDSYGDHNYFYIKTLTDDGDLNDGAYEGESIVGTIDGTTITFHEDYVFAVGDYEDEGLGWWKLTGLNEFTLYVEEDAEIDITEWSELATATMLDGWILPVLTYDNGTYAEPEDFPLTVQLYRHNEDENLILVKDPYMQSVSGFPLSGGQPGYIVMDVTEPDFVIVNTGVFSGFLNGTDKIFCTNVEGFYTAQGYPSSVIKQALGEDFPVWSSISVDDEGNTVIDIPTCRFQIASAPDMLYSWNNRADSMKAKFIYKDPQSGVNSVLAGETDTLAPAEYFNLQGQRVDNPAKGQLLIKRQGNTVTKMIAK